MNKLSRLRIMRTLFAAVAPIKNLLGNPDCKVHIAISATALAILQADGHEKEFEFYRNRFWAMEKGLIWADAGMKSAGHFYFPYGTRRGMRGHEHSMSLAEKYHDKALKLMAMGEVDIALLYVGAVMHLMQDAGIPQHATIRLLEGHRRYEKFVRSTYLSQEHIASGPAIEFDEIREFLQFNARIALKVRRHFGAISDESGRFERYAKCALPVAERTSAGYLLYFYRLAHDCKKPLAKPFKLTK